MVAAELKIELICIKYIQNMFPIEKLFIESYLRKIVNCYCYECVNGQEYVPLPTSSLAARVSDLYIWNGCPCDECCHSYEKSDVPTNVCKESCVIGQFDCMCFDCVQPKNYQTPELRYFDDIVVKKVAFEKYMYTDCLYYSVESDEVKYKYFIDIQKFDELCESFLVEKFSKEKILNRFSSKLKNCYPAIDLPYKRVHCKKCNLILDDRLYVDLGNLTWQQSTSSEYLSKENKNQFWSNDCPMIVKGTIYKGSCREMKIDEYNDMLLDIKPKTIQNIYWHGEFKGLQCKKYSSDIVSTHTHRSQINQWKQITFAERLLAYKDPEFDFYKCIETDLDKYYNKYKLHQYCFECNKYAGCCIPSDHEYPEPDEYKYVINKNDDEIVKLRKEVQELRDLLCSKIE